MDEWTRALQWARSGQAARWGPQTSRRQLLNHMEKHHGLRGDDVNEMSTPELAARHDGGHGGPPNSGANDPVNRNVRGKEHHHDAYTDTDRQREEMLAMSRMQQNQLYNDRRNPPAPRKPAGRGVPR
jgi:hypothetical protein